MKHASQQIMLRLTASPENLKAGKLGRIFFVHRGNPGSEIVPSHISLREPCGQVFLCAAEVQSATLGFGEEQTMDGLQHNGGIGISRLWQGWRLPFVRLCAL